MHVQGFHDAATGTVSYVVADPVTKRCAVIDSVLDYEIATGQASTHSADRLIQHIQSQGFTLEWILETHIHADHLTAASYLKEKLGGKTAMGRGILEVLAHWAPILEASEGMPLDGSQFDVLWEDGQTFTVGELPFKVLSTPGHTPACVTYVGPSAAFVGDTVFMPSCGTARVDFPGGDAQTHYQSIQKILSLPDETTLYICHDYPVQDGKAQWQTTVADEKQHNSFVNQDVSEADYVARRQARDQTLAMPKLLQTALQGNLRGRRLFQQ